MHTIDQALDLILAQVKPITTTERIPLQDAFQRVLAHPQIAQIDVPPADNSAMDGYALHTSSLNDNTTLPVSQRIPAGIAPAPLQPHTAARIFTGGEIPAGANAVVMQENCKTSDDATGVTVLDYPDAGNHIRTKGQDIACGSTLFQPGHCLHAADLGVLASVGIATVDVFQKIRVAVLSSGDELIEPGNPLNRGQIYNSNRYTLKGLLSSINAEMIDFGHIPDSPEKTIIALKDAANAADIIITTGGVSVGEEDHIKSAVEKLGQINLWKLAIKPGKPLAFGHVGNTPFFGLPGNPVSVFVTFIIAALPYLRKCQGRSLIDNQPLPLPADFFVEKNTTRQEYLRVRIENGKLSRFDNQSSGVLTSVSWANALAIVPINTEVAPGDTLKTIPFSSLGI